MAHEGRLRRLAQALLRGARGEGLLVAGVGSSMMADFGGVVGATQNRFALGHMGTALTCRGSCLKTGWLFPLMAMLREQVAALRRTLRPRERERNASGLVSLINCGLPSCSLDCYLDCTRTKVCATAGCQPCAQSSPCQTLAKPQSSPAPTHPTRALPPLTQHTSTPLQRVVAAP